jgi:hypothetical protein
LRKKIDKTSILKGVGTMKDIWYTLAVSKIGTHKMRFKEEMTRVAATEIGIKYCNEHGLEYKGTFSPHIIDDAEVELRLGI